jgi:hypothetical protein
MKNTASARLINSVSKADSSFPGVSLEDIAKMPTNDAVKTDMLKCLYDVDHAEVAWGLWFIHGLILAGRIDEKMMVGLIQRLPSLVGSDDPKVRSETIPILVMLRSMLPQYRNWMLKCLEDSYGAVRKIALLNSDTFLKPREVEPLLNFMDDDYLVETAMGGPLVYLLRNEALDRIEKRIGMTFERRHLSRILESGQKAQWWSWEPFLEWWEKPWFKRPFGRIRL